MNRLDATKAGIDVLANPERVYSAFEYRKIIAGLLVGRSLCPTCKEVGKLIGTKRKGLYRRYQCINHHAWTTGALRKRQSETSSKATPSASSATAGLPA